MIVRISNENSYMSVYWWVSGPPGTGLAIGMARSQPTPTGETVMAATVKHISHQVSNAVRTVSRVAAMWYL